MALGPFAAGFGQSLSLGAQLGLQYQREAREQERFAYLKQKDDRDQGLKVIESLGNIYKQQTSPAVKKAQAGFLFNHLEKATGQPIHPEIRELFKKANDEDVGMILNQATTLFKTDPTMGISLLMQGLGMDANKAMDYFVNYGKLQEQQLDYQANVQAGLGPAPTPPVQAPTPPAPAATPPAPQGPPLAMQGPTRYRAEVEAEAQRQGVPPDFASMILHTESSGNPNAVSPKGAKGLMQLMPGTQKRHGVTNPFNPQENIRGGVAELARLWQKYGGNRDLVAAAYNAGEGAVDKYGGIPPFPETQNYVRKVNGTVPTPAVTPEIRAIDDAIGSLEADVDRWRTLRGTTKIKELIANAEQKITRLQTRRGQLQTGQHQAVTEGQRQQEIDIRQREATEPKATTTAEELVSSQFGVTWAKATTDQRQWAVKEKQRLEIEGRGRQGTMTVPSAKDVAELVHAPSLRQGLIKKPGPEEAHLTGQELRQAGYVQMDQKQQDAWEAQETSEMLITTNEALAKRIIWANNPIEAGLQFGELTAAAKLGGTVATTYKDTLRSFLGNLSKSLAKEVGVLTDGDIERVTRAFPSFGDTKDIATLKFAIMKELQATARQAAIARVTGTGEPTKTWRGRLDTLLDDLEKPERRRKAEDENLLRQRLTPR